MTFQQGIIRVQSWSFPGGGKVSTQQGQCQDRLYSADYIVTEPSGASPYWPLQLRTLSAPWCRPYLREGGTDLRFRPRQGRPLAWSWANIWEETEEKLK